MTSESGGQLSRIDVSSPGVYSRMAFKDCVIHAPGGVERVGFCDTKFENCDLTRLADASFIGCIFEECETPPEWGDRVFLTVDVSAGVWQPLDEVRS